MGRDARGSNHKESECQFSDDDAKVLQDIGEYLALLLGAVIRRTQKERVSWKLIGVSTTYGKITCKWRRIIAILLHRTIGRSS